MEFGVFWTVVVKGEGLSSWRYPPTLHPHARFDHRDFLNFVWLKLFRQGSGILMGLFGVF